MREVLRRLSHARSQKLEVCYNGIECEASVNQELARRESDVAANTLQDKCQSNQIIYGHGVGPGFAEHHGIPIEHAVWIAMIREPMNWAVSLYKEKSGSQGYKGSFEHCVQEGCVQNAIQGSYVAKFVGFNDSQKPLNERARKWMKSKQVLTLFTEEYSASVHRLAKFLGASPEEELAMIRAAAKPQNVKPTKKYNVQLSRASLEKLKKDLEPADTVYNRALDILQSTRPQLLEVRQNSLLIRESDKNPDRMEIELSLDWYDDEE